MATLTFENEFRSKWGFGLTNKNILPNVPHICLVSRWNIAKEANSNVKCNFFSQQTIYLKIVKTIFTFGLQGWPQLKFSLSIFKSNVSGHDSSRGRTISKVTILLESWLNTVNYFWHFSSEIITSVLLNFVVNTVVIQYCTVFRGRS